MVVTARHVASETAASTKLGAKERMEGAKARAMADVELVRGQAIQAKDSAAVKAKELYTATGDLVSQKSFQTTTASAAAGGMALGAGGAAAGTVTGGVAGAVAGLPLALFTFGLSIPVGAIVGGGAGLVIGAAAGATTGAVGGGLAGYSVYQKKDELMNAGNSAVLKASNGVEVVKGQVSKTVLKASNGVEVVKGQVSKTVGHARDMVSAAKTRFAGGEVGAMDIAEDIAKDITEDCAENCAEHTLEATH